MAGLRRAGAVFLALGLLLPLLAAGGAPLAAGQEPGGLPYEVWSLPPVAG